MASPNPYIDLKANPCRGKPARYHDAHPFIFLILSDCGAAYLIWEKQEAIVFDVCLTDLSDDALQLRKSGRAEAEQVDVARNAMQVSFPQREQHGSFEHEAVAVWGATETIQEALQCVSDEN